MIKTIVLGAGALVGVGVLAYLTRRWWVPSVALRTIDDKQPLKVKKEIIDKLSYEYIIKSVENSVSGGELKGVNTGKATLLVMPNNKALEYYDNVKSQGKTFFIGEELTDDEKSKMVVVLITGEDDMGDVLWGRVFIPEELSDDFHDIIIEDKIYMKSVNWDIDDVGGKTTDDEADSWKLLQEACESPVWMVDEVFTSTGALRDYVVATLEKSAESKPVSVCMCPIRPLLQYIEVQKHLGPTITDDNLQRIEQKLQDGIQNAEVLLCLKVNDSEGKESIANPVFVKAEKGFETKIQKALDKELLFVKTVVYAKGDVD